MRKLRTREHIIEDLGFNHVEKQVLLTGFVLQRNLYDYGYDATINTFNETGEAENKNILFQLKSTDHLEFSDKKQGFVFDLSKRDLELWLSNLYVVLLILYDAQKDVAYFVDLQVYFNENRILLKNVRKFVRVYIPPKSIFNVESLKQIRNLNQFNKID